MGYVDIVFDRLPDHEGANFIEVENEAGASINFGVWTGRPDGTVALRVLRPDNITAFSLYRVDQEMGRAREKYPQQHDDEHGSGHLVTEALYRLQHMGEHPTDMAVQHEIAVAIGLLFNAIATLERAGS